MYRRTHRTHPYLKALTAVAVLALAFFAGLDGASMADGSGDPAKAQLAPSTMKPAADGAEESSDADRRKTADAVNKGRTRPGGRPLTTQQKRIFVLGLGASQKN